VGEVEAPSMDPNQELSNLKRKFESWKREFKVGGAACPPAQSFSLFPSIFPPSFLPNVCLQCFHCSLSLFLLLFFSLMFGGEGGGGAQQSAQVLSRGSGRSRWISAECSACPLAFPHASLFLIMRQQCNLPQLPGTGCSALSHLPACRAPAQRLGALCTEQARVANASFD